MQTLDIEDEASLSACHAVFRFLRPHLDEAAFKQRVRAQYAEGYRIVFLQSGGAVVAAAGYRVMTFLAWGKVLYVDDLITLPEMTGRGFGGALIDYLVSVASARNCSEIHLDTGYQRHAAHKLYLRKGLQLSCHHMSMAL